MTAAAILAVALVVLTAAAAAITRHAGRQVDFYRARIAELETAIDGELRINQLLKGGVS